MIHFINVGNATLRVSDLKVIKGEHVTIIPGEFIDGASHGLAIANVIIDKEGTTIRLNPMGRGEVTVHLQHTNGEKKADVYTCNGKDVLRDVIFERNAVDNVESLGATVLGAFDVTYTPELVDFARALVDSAPGFWKMLTTDMLIETLKEQQD